MGLIFWFSAQTSASSVSLSKGVLRKLMALTPNWDSLSTVAQARRVQKVHLLFRKLGHFSEYTVLGAFSSLTARIGFPADEKKKQRVRYFLMPACFALLYAIGDEIHQIFVPGRTAAPVDVLIDFSGGCLGILLIACAAWLIARRRAKKAKSDI